MSELSPAGITAVGLGSAGTRIVSLLSRQSVVVDRFAFISCDSVDLARIDRGDKLLIESPMDQKLTPALVRGLSFGSVSRIREVLKGSKVVFIVAGLGGATGSGLAPLVASIGREVGAVVVGVAVMPFEYEKKLKFYAGVSLRRLRAESQGVVVIDNGTLMESSPEDSSLVEIYDAANREAVRALGALMSNANETGVPLGLNKLLATAIQEGYSLLGMRTSNSSDRTEEALAGAAVSIGKVADSGESNRAVVVLSGNGSLSAKEVATAVKRLPSMLDNEDVDIEYGVNFAQASDVQVSVLASGFRSTKYDDYDPLHGVLGDRVLDDEADSSLPLGLEILPPCE
jgi:cell division protein FtsZ